MKLELDANTLKNHFTYSWWKYLIVLVVGILGVDLLYEVTKPRIPDNARMEIVITGYVLNPGFDDYLEDVRKSQFPDILETSVSIAMEDATTAEYLTTKMAVHEGDLYILSRTHYQNMVSNGVLLPLDDDEELLRNILGGVEIEEGWVLDYNSRDKHLYGISLNYLPYLKQFYLVNDGFLCVYRYGRNLESAQKLLHIIAGDTKAMPETQSAEPPAV